MIDQWQNRRRRTIRGVNTRNDTDAIKSETRSTIIIQRTRISLHVQTVIFQQNFPARLPVLRRPSSVD